MRMLFILWMLFVGGAGRVPTSSPAAPTQESCTYDERCGAGMCMVWEHSRFVCEPKQYTVAVWDRSCIDKLELSESSQMEAPLDDEGKPDIAKSQLTHTKVTFAKGCQFHYDVRNR